MPDHPVRAALARLVELKDGPRDDEYQSAKDVAWADARRALVVPEPPDRDVRGALTELGHLVSDCYCDELYPTSVDHHHGNCPRRWREDVDVVTREIARLRAENAADAPALAVPIVTCPHCGDGFTVEDIAAGDVAVVCSMCAKAGRSPAPAAPESREDRGDGRAERAGGDEERRLRDHVHDLEATLYWLASSVSTEWVSPPAPVREALEAAFDLAGGRDYSAPLDRTAILDGLARHAAEHGLHERRPACGHTAHDHRGMGQIGTPDLISRWEPCPDGGDDDAP